MNDLDWSEVFTSFQPKIYNYIFRRTSDHYLTEDLTSETFVKALDSDKQGNGSHSSLSGWLYRIAHNLVIDHYRIKDRQKSVSIDEVIYLPDKKNDPVKLAEFNFDMKVVDALIRYLTPEQAQVMTLRYIDGCSFDEIAFLMGKSESAVKGILHRAFQTTNFILSDNVKESQPRRHEGCWVAVKDTLCKNGPMTSAELEHAIRQTQPAVAYALRKHPKVFMRLGKREYGQIGIWIWGLVGIHDQKEAA